MTPEQILLRVALLFAALVVIMAIVGLTMMKGERAPNYWRRYVSLVSLTALFVTPAYIGGWVFAIAVMALITLALGEFWELLDLRALRPLHALGVCLGLSLPVVAMLGSAGALILAWLAALALLWLLRVGAGAGPQRAQTRALLGQLALGVSYVAWLPSFFILLRNEAGFGPVVYLLVVVQFADLGAYLGGMRFGKHALTPKISPKKTWEGFGFGCANALFAGLVFSFALPGFSVAHNLGFALVLAVQSVLGDLFASSVKRLRGVSDFSQMLPGHGGLIDRFDGYFFCVPVAWLVLRLSERPPIPTLGLLLILLSGALIAMCSLVAVVRARLNN